MGERPGWKGRNVNMRGLLSTRLLGAAMLAGLASAGAGAIELDVTAIQSAFRMARSAEADRTRFHAPYLLPGTLDTIERLEVITEFRRLVLLTEERLAAGDWSFSSDTRAAAAAIRPWKDKLAIRARIRFHPHNVYTAPPRITIDIGAGPNMHQPINLTSDPQFRLGTVPPVLIGVVVEASFDAPAVGPRVATVIVRGPGTAKVVRTVDLRSLR
jgi:hypothetical protein